MDFAVLIKVVPDVEKMRYDPDRKTMIREGSELFINPFDQRAVRVALDARRPGELVTVVSMGPPSAEAALQETLALGADRAVLLTDRQLAGSDTLVTVPRALVKVLTRVGSRRGADGNLDDGFRDRSSGTGSGWTSRGHLRRRRTQTGASASSRRLGHYHRYAQRVDPFTGSSPPRDFRFGEDHENP